MGITSSHESAPQSPTSPTHNDSVDLASTAITNVTPAATIKRSKSAKSLPNSWKTPQQLQNHHVRQASVRSRAALPMPDHSELDKRFAKVLVSPFHNENFRIGFFVIFFFLYRSKTIVQPTRFPIRNPFIFDPINREQFMLKLSCMIC